MEVQVCIGQSYRYQLREALLIYGDQRDTFITRHDVWTETGHVPQLGPAEPVTMDFAERLAQSLLGVLPLALLPETVLATGTRSIVWWSRPMQRQMFYRSADGTAAQLDGKLFPQPALVWKVRHDELTVRACTAASRPTAETRLAVAPFWNVSGEGKVCMGTMRHPHGASGCDLAAWETAFYESAFSHANAARLTRHAAGFEGLWSGLIGKHRFPVDTLIELPETLADFVHGKD